jgi:Cu+-exporting ATPase
MFQFFRKPKTGSTVTFKINGMHCTSCSMNIDGELEDADGVFSASTNYAQAKTKINFDEKKISKDQLRKIIEDLDYQVEKEIL